MNAYQKAANKLIKAHDGVDNSTMMKSACLRYRGDFFAMAFTRGDGIIVKLSPERVNELISAEQAAEFNYTSKRFKEWAIVPSAMSDSYESRMREALEYVKSK